MKNVVSHANDVMKHVLCEQSKVELITKHRKVISEFIESIDFDLLQKSDKRGQCFVSLLNLLILICYKRRINRTVVCEFIEFTEFDTLQKRDK